MTIDILPTIAALTGATLPKHKIDGLDIWPLIASEGPAESPHEAYFFYWDRDLQAVRSGNWKLHFPHSYRTLGGQPGGKGGMPVKYSEARTDLALYDLAVDVEEKRNVASQHAEIVGRLQELAEKAREELGDRGRPGKGCREPGRR